MDKIERKKRGVPLTVYVEKDMALILRRQADSRGVTVSQLVRECLYKFNK